MYVFKERACMPEQLQNIIWMAEELDFNLQSELKAETEAAVLQFLELVANPAVTHWLY